MTGDQISEAFSLGYVKLGGERKTISVLMAEVREFNNLASALEPESLVAYACEYLGIISDCVIAQSGQVDHFHHGRRVTAIFGTPAFNPRHATNAVGAALAIRDAMSPFDQRRPPIHVDLAVATGDAVVGNVGSEQRVEYTALGSAVIEAELLLSEARHISESLLFSPQTVAATRESFRFRLVSESAFAIVK